MKMNMPLNDCINKLEFIDAMIGLIGVACILGGAFFMQLFYGEQPCLLCLLQRAGFVGIGLSLLMTLRYGNHVHHWASVIICAAAGMAVSLRQICLHITSTQGFGSAVWGYHMYTWCFFGFSLAIIGSAFMLLIYPDRRTRESIL